MAFSPSSFWSLTGREGVILIVWMTPCLLGVDGAEGTTLEGNYPWRAMHLCKHRSPKCSQSEKWKLDTRCSEQKTGTQIRSLGQGHPPSLNTWQTLASLTWQAFFFHFFLHTVSNQNLKGGKASEWGYFLARDGVAGERQLKVSSRAVYVVSFLLETVF